MESISTETWIAVGSICFSQFIITAILLGVIFASRAGAAKAKDWQPVPGTVLMSTLEARRGSRGHYVNYPVVHYQYRVGGTTYQNRKISPGMEWGGSGAGKVVARYPTGSQVTVYYNPENPAEALLERNVPSVMIWLWITLIIVNVFLCGMSAVFYFTL